MIIHFYRKELREHVAEEIESLFEKGNIHMEVRKNRISKGFDFDSKVRDFSASHSQLVSRVIAKFLLDN